MGIVGIGYWSSGTCGYWVLKFWDLWVLGIEVLVPAGRESHKHPRPPGLTLVNS